MIKIQPVIAVIILAIIWLYMHEVNAFEVVNNRPCNLPFEVEVVRDMTDDMINSYVYSRVMDNERQFRQTVNEIIIKTGDIVPQTPIVLEFDTRWAIILPVMPDDILLTVFSGTEDNNYISCYLVIEYDPGLQRYFISDEKGA